MGRGPVGLGIPNRDSQAKVIGSAIYLDDLRLPGMLHGKILWSRYPHARVLNIDPGRALALPGVKAVVTSRDCSPIRYGDVRDRYFLARDKVRCLADPVAAVAATDLATASAALALIEVEYQPLPAVFDPVEAMGPKAPLIHEEIDSYVALPGLFPVPGSNVCNRFTLEKGDVARGFHGSWEIFEDTFRTRKLQHCAMEPHAAIAHFDRSGKLTVWSGTQTPYKLRSELASSLGMRLETVRVIVPAIGGGFGGKGSMRLEPICALLSQRSGSPVKIKLTREEVFTSTIVSQPALIKLKTGVTREGRLVTRQVTMVWDSGAYSEVGATLSKQAGYSAAGPYSIPHVKIESLCVYTNNPPGGPLRGFGMLEVTWAIESQMDIIAEKLKIDPVELRLRNVVEEGSVSAGGERLHSVGVKEALLKAADAVSWGTPKAEKFRGKGIACMHKSSVMPSSSSAFIKVNENGSCQVLTSAVDLGQGSNTVLAQVVSQETGIPLEMIEVMGPDTDFTPHDWGTISSRVTFGAGNACKAAAEDVGHQLRNLAAELLEANPGDIQLENGNVYVTGSPEIRLTIPEVARVAHLEKGGPIIGRGSFIVRDQSLSPASRMAAFWMYAAQAAEVEVDIDTGQVRVLKLVGVHDVGKAINPLACVSQVEGSLVMGLSVCLWEEMLLSNGVVLNPNFTDYKLALAVDVPELQVQLVEEPHREGPYGAKGIGEPGFVATPPAIANAIRDAIGVRIKELPVTPEKILAAIAEKRNSIISLQEGQGKGQRSVGRPRRAER